jgi:predicted branched-subunit amino acid permease
LLRFERLDLRALWRHPACAQGMRDMARVMPGLMAWAVITGVVMAKSGLPTWVAASMALCVFAASAQLSAVPLLMAGAPLWVIWLTAACVNLRFVIFSAQMRRHMMCLPLRWRLLAGYLSADVVYVMAVNRHGEGPDAGPEHTEPLAYFMGLAVVNWPGWSLAALAGVFGAAWIPTKWGLGFAGALALLALLVNLSRDCRTFMSAVAAGAVAAALYDLPFKLYIVVAVLTGVGLGLAWDAWRPVRETRDGSAA